MEYFIFGNHRVLRTVQMTLAGVALLFGSQLQAQTTLPENTGITLLPADVAGSLLTLETSSSNLYGHLATLNAIYLANPGQSLPEAIARIQTGSLAVTLPTLIDDAYVMVDAVATVGNVADLRAELEALGMRNTDTFGNVISGEFPVASLNDAANINSLNFMSAVVAERLAGLVQSQAGQSMNAENIMFNGSVLDGTGIKVGVLSDSYDASLTATSSAADDIATGDLPPADRITILDDFTPQDGLIDEGRAMMQLIHDVAPGADMSFHTAFRGQASFAQGILDLADDGADIIVDDVIIFAEPFFQDGVIAQAVDEVVADGVPYFSAAGNAADQSYEAEYVDGGTVINYSDTQTLVNIHDIDATTDGTQVHSLTIQPGQSGLVVLQWDTPFASTGGAGAQNDVNMILTDSTGTVLLADSSDSNIGGDGVEILQATWNGNEPLEALLIFGIAQGSGGSLPGRLKFIDFRGEVAYSPALSDSTIVAHQNAAGALSIGAAYYQETPAFGTNPPLLEPFSALGGTKVLLDTTGNPLPSPDDRMKPDFVAPDGVDTTFFGFDSDDNGFPNFFGTSAAAPNVAAAAALVLEAYPTLTPAQLGSALASNAIDMNSPGVDSLSGTGLIDVAATIGDDVDGDPSITTPIPGSVLAGYTDTFNWVSNGAAVAQYWVYVGSSAGGYDYGTSGSLLPTDLSYSPTALPLDGSTVYVTFFWLLEGEEVWQKTEYTYTAATAMGPSFTSPISGGTLAGVSDTFEWDDNDSGATEYWLYLGAAPGDREYYNSGSLGTDTFATVEYLAADGDDTVSFLPTDGSTVYARLWYRTDSNNPIVANRWLFIDDTFVAATSGGPSITSPIPGSVVSGSPVTFTWEPGEADVTEWWLYAGSAPGTFDIYNSGEIGTALSASVPMPEDNSTVHVTLWFRIDGIWRSVNYVYESGSES